jgi:hypothetical protein
MADPLLLDGLKFDFRVYACVTSLNPFTVYLFHNGLARFATHAYEKPTVENRANNFMHLTNYSLNKSSETFRKTARPPGLRRRKGASAAPDPNEVTEEFASKRTIGTILQQFAERAKTDKAYRDPLMQPKRFWKEVADVVEKSFIAILPPLWRRYSAMFGPKGGGSGGSMAKLSTSATPEANSSKCFQIIGIDLMLATPPAPPKAANGRTRRSTRSGASNLKMYLLELNQNPSFMCSDSEVDYMIKQGVLGQSLELMDLVKAPFPAPQGQTPFEYTRLHPYNKYGYMLESVARAQAKYQASS